MRECGKHELLTITLCGGHGRSRKSNSLVEALPGPANVDNSPGENVSMVDTIVVKSPHMFPVNILWKLA